VLWLARKTARCSVSQRPWSRARGQEPLAARVEQRKKRQQSCHGDENPQDSVARPHKPFREALRSR